MVKERAVIEEALGTVKRHLGRLNLVGEPMGAEVLLSGRSVGHVPLPGPVTVNAGLINIELRKTGFEGSVRNEQVGAGQFVTVVMKLKPSQTLIPGAVGAQDVTVPGLSINETVQVQPGESPMRPFYRRTWFWVAAGVVVVGAISAGLLLSRGSSHRTTVEF